uniref:Uncharacterized protein n=1 Tax=Avena sativa TaxID=4498 RepID=A0ACD5U2R7_AVESA
MGVLLVQMPPPPMLVAIAFCGTSSLAAGWLLFGRNRRLRRLQDDAPAGSDDEAGQDRLIEHDDSGEDNDAPASSDEEAGQDSRIEHDSVGPGSPEGACDSWLSEVMLLRGLCHKNIMNLVPAAASSSTNAADDELGLAYDHTENGSLDKWLHPLPATREGEQRRPLSWPTRRAVAIGVAGGLCYLHRRSIIHHNINSSNVMLDRAFNPKIAGFGLAQKISNAGPDDDQDQQPTVHLPTGNFGYTAPDYVTMIGELTEKADVYSFGVVLLELVTGRVANEPAAVIEDGRGVAIVNHHQPCRRHRHYRRLAHHHLPTWARDVVDNRGGFNSNVVDQRIPDKARYMREMAATFKLGVDCTIPNAHRRPSMARVLKRLRYHGSMLSWIKSRRIMRCLP